MKYLPIIAASALCCSSFVAATGGGGLRKHRTLQDVQEAKDPQLTFESRIVGGTEAGVDEYPFYVNWGGQCGASLIAREWIMSAAHCDPISTNNVKINRSRGIGYDSGRGEMATIIDRFPHPNYNGNTHDNDIMIMKLEKPVDFDPIPLNFNDNLPRNDQGLKVIGFGRLVSGGSSPRELQEVVVQYVDNDTCNRDESYDGDITDQMLCAGVPGGGKDSCQGDSGGPIFTYDGGISQVGVVSWGRGCARPDKPGVYARVSSYESWIKGIICTDDEHITQYKPDFCGGSESNPSPVGTRPPTQTPISVGTRPPTQAPTSIVDSENGSGTRPPTQIPTPAPTSSFGSSGNGSAQLRLEMTYDDFPQEVFWEIIQNGQVVGSGRGNSGQNMETVSYTYSVEEGYTQFHLIDTAEDGICCYHGYGGYELYVDVDGNSQKVADSDGMYTSSETKSFTISSSGSSAENGVAGNPPTRPPTQAPTSSSNGSPTRPPTAVPTSSGGSGSAQLRLKITYDEFPDEVSWQIIQSGQTVASGRGNSDQAEETVRYTYDVSEGDTEFILEDAADDGICCYHGYGEYEIRVKVDGNVRTVAESDGSFSSSETTTFTI